MFIITCIYAVNSKILHDTNMGKYIIACKASNSFLNNIYLSVYKTPKIFFFKMEHGNSTNSTGSVY